MMTTRRGIVRGALAAAVASWLGVRPAAGQSAWGAYWENVVYEAAWYWGADGDLMVRVMYCESGGDPSAVSTRLNVNGTHDLGLFQINALTWQEWEQASGLSGDPMNGYDNAQMAAWAFANGLEWHWACRGMV